MDIRVADNPTTLGAARALVRAHFDGCAAFQTIAQATAELKRVFVRPDARRRGIARALMVHAIATIRERGCARVRLGTQETAIGAQRLYEGLGFRRIEPYRKADFGTVWFYELLM